MTKFEIIRSISSVGEFASLVFNLARKSETAEELAKDLSVELTEEGLQTIMSVAQEGNYPLFLEDKPMMSSKEAFRIERALMDNISPEFFDCGVDSGMDLAFYNAFGSIQLLRNQLAAYEKELEGEEGQAHGRGFLATHVPADDK